MSLSPQAILSFVDLTSLNDTDTDEVITSLCNDARGADLSGHEVAAVCVYPRFVELAKRLLTGTTIKIATVANFPHGDKQPSQLEEEVAKMIKDGADEIDFVIPWKKFKEDKDAVQLANYVRAMVAMCKPCKTKAILESSELPDDLLALASEVCIRCGVDFLKTSTGKVGGGATVNAATVMVRTIVQHRVPKAVGFKASGGIRTYADAMYIAEAVAALAGESYLNSNTFRIGASSLRKSLIDEMKKNKS